MPITRLTLTGIDDLTDRAALNALFAEYPFLEFGLLYSEGRAGTARYPSLATLHGFVDALQAPIAVHVCGPACQAILTGWARPELTGLLAHPRVGRVQINTDLGTSDPAALERALAAIGKPVILQDNPANAAVLPAIGGERVEILFDASGGRGRRPETWPTPHPTRSCGYAGGLTPETMPAELVRISRAAADRRVWVDLESGLRDAADRFSLARAYATCAAVSRHIEHRVLAAESAPSLTRLIEWLADRDPNAPLVIAAIERAGLAVHGQERR